LTSSSGSASLLKATPYRCQRVVLFMGLCGTVIDLVPKSSLSRIGCAAEFCKVHKSYPTLFFLRENSKGLAKSLVHPTGALISVSSFFAGLRKSVEE